MSQSPKRETNLRNGTAENVERLEVFLTAEKCKTQLAENFLEHEKTPMEQRKKEWDKERTMLLDRQQELSACFEQSAIKLQQKLYSEREHLQQVKYQLMFLRNRHKAKTGDLHKVIEQKNTENTDALNKISVLEDSLNAEKVRSTEVEFLLPTK